MNGSLEKKIKEQALFFITDLSGPAALIDFGFFLAIVFLTPVYKRYPMVTLAFGVGIGTLSLFRYLLAITRKSWSKDRLPLWRQLFQIGFYANALAWSLMCSGALMVLELGWTSFLIMIITISLAATKVPILAPDFNMVRAYLVILFGPAAIVPALSYSGQRGWALAVFFLGFFCVLLIQGLAQHRKFWAAARDSARLHAMIDAIPGTLSWVSSDLHYLGVNQKLADLWNMASGNFVGKPVGFSDKRSRMTEFTTNLFVSTENTQVKEILVQRNQENRYFYIVGKKYNEDTEAVILGMDVTDYRRTLEDLKMQKDQSTHLAKFANLGERTADLTLEIRSCLAEIRKSFEAGALTFTSEQQSGGAATSLFGDQGSLTHIERVVNVIGSLINADTDEVEQEINFQGLLEDTLSVFRSRLRIQGIELQLTGLDVPTKLRCRPHQLQEVLMCLINNAISAIQHLSSPWIRISISDQGDRTQISVTDSGNGIPSEVRDRIFDPLFTTKNEGKSTGVGLTISRDMIARQGGVLVLDAESPHTRFVIEFPHKALRQPPPWSEKLTVS